MPTYYPRWTTVQLAVADLADTTINKPESRSHPGVNEEISRCTAKFAKASENGTLDETPISTEDVNRSDMRYRSGMHYLGKSGNMPFFMVRAGRAFLELDTAESGTRRAARVPPYLPVNSVSRPQYSTFLQSSAINDGVKAERANKPRGREDGQYISHVY